jgi:hypothetical protein
MPNITPSPSSSAPISTACSRESGAIVATLERESQPLPVTIRARLMLVRCEKPPAHSSWWESAGCALASRLMKVAIGLEICLTITSPSLPPSASAMADGAPSSLYRTRAKELFDVSR